MAQDHKQNEVQFEVGEALNIYEGYIATNQTTWQNMSPSFSLGYYRFATKSIAYGFTTGYVYADRYEDWGKFYTTEREYFSDVNSFFFAPTFKWAYYNKPTLQMYLGAQIGMKLDKAITRIDNRYLSNEKIIHRTSTYLYGTVYSFWYQLRT